MDGSLGDNAASASHFISRISTTSWKTEMENVTASYHVIGAWIAIVFDPLFAVTDYFNIRKGWEWLLLIRLSVSLLTALTLFAWKRFKFPSYYLVLVPFLLISLQNAYTFNLIETIHLIGHNLNYIALMIGASMFIMWEVVYSLTVLFLSALATTFFMLNNPSISPDDFFVKGGLLLAVSGVFMVILIKTRYDLTVREIKSRLALQLSNDEIQHQNKELQRQKDIIKGINENLETLVTERTQLLQRKNRALEEYAFINAHKLRAPLASILGLIDLMSHVEQNEESRKVVDHLEKSASKLDEVVTSITRAIERGD
ncbi:hypothetical protein BH10BAC4_BH10BAC4_19800 [soil metagenome]